MVLLLFTVVERNVQDGRKDKRKKNYSEARPVILTIGPVPDSSLTSTISRQTDMRLGRTRVPACKESASIQEPMSMSEDPVVVYVVRTHTRDAAHQREKKTDARNLPIRPQDDAQKQQEDLQKQQRRPSVLEMRSRRLSH